MKGRSTILLLGLALVLRTHADPAAGHVDADGQSPTGHQTRSAKPEQQTTEQPSLPMKRLDGADKAELLDAIEKQQATDADASDNAGSSLTDQSQDSQRD